MKNNLRRLIAVLGVATLGVVGGATGAYSQATETQTAAATATIQPECDIDLQLVDDMDGDIIDTASTNDLEGDVQLKFTCNTANVSIDESTTFSYSGPASIADIFQHVTVTATNFDGTSATITALDTVSHVSSNNVTITPGLEVVRGGNGQGGDNTDEFLIEPINFVMPAGVYSMARTVTVAPN